MSITYSCQDFLGFQEALKKMRDIDDKIIYALNSSIPTESFKNQISSEATCKELYANLKKGHSQREEAIKQCILFSANKLQDLKEKREDHQADREFKAEQRRLRVLQSELNVEDIISERSFKIFNERCRNYFVAGKNL